DGNYGGGDNERSGIEQKEHKTAIHVHRKFAVAKCPKEPFWFNGTRLEADIYYPSSVLPVVRG
ncbi:hypothetical protein, partial [Acetobacter okinawensis]|uniref:hypothetical protein n=1 Tax=Acetobacter okinawensis TaxID=1076594 RepID=UPI001BA6C73C